MTQTTEPTFVAPCGHVLPLHWPTTGEPAQAPPGIRFMELIGLDAGHWVLLGGRTGSSPTVDQVQLGHWDGILVDGHWDVREESGPRMFDETWTVVDFHGTPPRMRPR